MARVLSLQETIQRSQELAKQARPEPTIGQKVTAAGVGQPTTAFGASLVPGVTPDQAKMMGTPAQKGATIAQLGGETQLEQAVKLRGPSTASVEEEAKKRRAASLSQAAGTFGDKANELVERTFQTITAQKVGEDNPLQLKVNSAAQAVSGLSPTDQAATGQLLGQIGSLQQQLTAETDPAKKEALATQINNLTLQLNTKLGRDATTALQAADVTALVSSTAIPDAVKEAATAGMKTAIGDKLTLKDLGDLGTSPEELAALLNVDPATISDMSISDLENAFASLTQTAFGETGEVQAGLAPKSLLSSAEKVALMDVLTQMQETGVAGAELQVAQLGGQIAEGKTVTVGGQQYTIEELMSTEEMTTIVKDVLDKPDGPFATSLKETEPEFYNWIIGSRDGLQALLTGAGTATQAFRTTQEANIKLLEPLSKHSDFFKTLGFDTKALRTGTLKVTDLPPSAQAVFKLPPDKQSIAFGNLATLPPDQVKTLTADEVANLGLDRDDGLWSRYRNEVQSRSNLSNIPDSDTAGMLSALKWGISLEDANRNLADAVLLEAMGGPRHPLLDVDFDKNGIIDAKDLVNIKKNVSSAPMPSLKEVAQSGNIPSATGNIPNGGAPVNYGNVPTQQFVGMARDNNLSPEEQNQLSSDPAFSIEDLERLANTSFAANNPQFRNGLTNAINSKVQSSVFSGLDAVGVPRDIVNQLNGLVIPTDSWRRNDEEWNGIGQRMDQARNAINALQQLSRAAPNPRIRAEFDAILSGLQSLVNNKQAAIDKFNAEFYKENYTAKGSTGFGGVIGQAAGDLGKTTSTGVKRLLRKGLA